MTAFVAGFALGFSLIVAIGAQNAYILKQGLKREHVFVLCGICALSDAVLIMLGVGGFAVLVSQMPQVETAARYGGAAFLFAYGARSFWAALRHSDALVAAGGATVPLHRAVLMCLAFTWLNPHVWLDTVVLLGSLSTQYPGQRVTYAAGATCASFVFFYSLGYGARLLAPLFQKPVSWRVLEGLIGVVMWSIAVGLLV